MERNRSRKETMDIIAGKAQGRSGNSPPLQHSRPDSIETQKRRFRLRVPLADKSRNPLFGFSDGKGRLDILCGCRDKEGTLLWREDWVPDDFRRTFKSAMEENLWAPRAVIDAMMDHQEPEVAGNDNTAQYLEPMRQAYPKWEAYVLNAAKLASSA
jgi:hypothetical protein